MRPEKNLDLRCIDQENTKTLILSTIYVYYILKN